MSTGARPLGRLSPLPSTAQTWGQIAGGELFKAVECMKVNYALRHVDDFDCWKSAICHVLR
jgi:hypothetical protein